jgi:hypothetical protein
MKKFLLLVLIKVAFCACTLAQAPDAAPANNPQQSAVLRQNKIAAAGQATIQSSMATPVCSYNFSFGSGDAALNYCVTVNGNITSIETPEAHQNVAVEQAEGYGICDQTTGIAYSDFAGMGDSGNWGPPTLVSHSATAVKIARTTSDGVWTLTQVITQVTGTSPHIRIAMTLKNNTAAPRNALLLRYLDADVDEVVLNSTDANRMGAAEWNSIEMVSPDEAVGLMLQTIGDHTFAHQALVQTVYYPPDPCNAFAHRSTVELIYTDASMVMTFQPLVAAHSSVTANMMYQGW